MGDGGAYLSVIRVKRQLQVAVKVERRAYGNDTPLRVNATENAEAPPLDDYAVNEFSTERTTISVTESEGR